MVLIIVIMAFAFPKTYAQQSTDPCGTIEFDCYQESGFRLNSDPVICMNTPDDPTLFAQLAGYTDIAIAEWSSLLNAGGTSRIPKWNIHLIPSTASNICNITIDFFSKPPPDDKQPDVRDALGVTYYNFNDHTAHIRIFYDGIREYEERGVIEHELGHAFGLGHYIIHGYEDHNPSMMAPFLADTIYPVTVPDMDIIHLESLYNNNGFGGNAQTTFPSMQPSTTPQQISINTDKQVYYYGDRVTTTINVSRVTGENATMTIVINGPQTENFTTPIEISQLHTSFTSPNALNETNVSIGNVEFTVLYDGQTASTSFQIIGEYPTSLPSSIPSQDQTNPRFISPDNTRTDNSQTVPEFSHLTGMIIVISIIGVIILSRFKSHF